MGRKRSSKKKSNKKSTGNIDLAVIILLVVSILLFVLIYGENGAIGEMLSPMLGGVIGFIKYIIPIGTIAIAVCIAKEDKSYMISKLFQYAVFLACIAGMMTIYQISKGAINIDNQFNEVLDMAYSLGEKNIGGGIVGAVIAYPLIQLLGMFGAAIATIGVAFILLVFTFGIQPTEIILNILDAIDERRAEREEQYEDFIEKRNNRRKQRETNKTNNKVEQVEKESSKKPEKQIPAPVDENQITINLNNHNLEEEPADKKGKFNIFGNRDKSSEKIKGDGVRESAEDMNPNEINDYFVQEQETKEDKTKQVLNLQHNATIVEDEDYEFPPVEILKQGTSKPVKGGKKALTDTATKLQRTLYSFGVSAKVENVSVGPAITRYELKPAEGVRVSKIAKLSDDIALNLAAESIRIEAPIPGKQAVGIEIPNVEKEIVHFRDVVESKEFKDAESKLSMGLGKNIAGEIVIANIGKMPHVLENLYVLIL